ncbi:hypothetical protein [Algoriphagus boritolerans]|uniref:hypothetical protein n=1 Tax=Algoriphagus boritolerans TaxID=308111 RepID=UPI000A9EA756
MGKLLLEKYPGFSPEEKLEAMQTLSSRARYGNMVTQELKNKKNCEIRGSRQCCKAITSGSWKWIY